MGTDSEIKRRLSDANADGYLLVASGTDPNQRFITAIDIPITVVTLLTEERRDVLVRGLDASYVRRTGNVDNVATYSEYATGSLGGRPVDRYLRSKILPKVLHDRNVSSVVVSSETPVKIVTFLRNEGIEVIVDSLDSIPGTRAKKTPDEIESIKSAQVATERAMSAAEELLARADISSDTLLYEGQPLKVEQVKRKIRTVLAGDGYEAGDIIVAQGEDATEPHNRGKGVLRCRTPIIVDIFPRATSTGYMSDMTRTFLRGDPSAEVREKYELVRRAQETALELIEPDVTGQMIHRAVCEVFERRGISTTRTEPNTTEGFVHVTGHGVGLTVHESPVLAEGGEKLRPGHVVTVEPGYYDPAIGGIRIEDLVVVTEDGHESLTSYRKQLKIDPRT